MHVRYALVRPAAVHDEQLRKEAELAKRVVRAHCCLRALVTEQTNANVGFLNHGDIVCAIANRERHGLAAVFDELNREGLLSRAHTTADDGVALSAEIEEERLERRVECKAQSIAVDDDRKAWLFRRALLSLRQSLQDSIWGVCGGAMTNSLDARNAVQTSLNLCTSCFRGVGGQNHNVHRWCEQVAAERDFDGSLNLVACNYCEQVFVITTANAAHQ